MFNKADLSYIEQTESYIIDNRDSMPEVVYSFLNQICQDERKMIQLAKEYSNTKGILKKPEARLI
jgi:hypothetical protein